MKTYLFNIQHDGEPGAGIHAYTDYVTIEIESGDPGGEPGEFQEFIESALREWYDGASVTHVFTNRTQERYPTLVDDPEGRN